MSDSPDNVVRFGGGGKLYQDARDMDEVRAAAAAAADADPPKPPPPVEPPPPTQVVRANMPEPPGRDYREMFSTSLELTGIALLITSGFLIALWLGTLIAGLCLILLGAASSSTPPSLRAIMSALRGR